MLNSLSLPHFPLEDDLKFTTVDGENHGRRTDRTSKSSAKRPKAFCA